MATTTHILGYPRIGEKRELKFALANGNKKARTLSLAFFLSDFLLILVNE